jgi:hypothetical protein
MLRWKDLAVTLDEEAILLVSVRNMISSGVWLECVKDGRRGSEELSESSQ